MMKFLKNIIVLFLLLICLISISAISAVDLEGDSVIGDNGTDNLSVTLSENNLLSLDDENDGNSNGVYYVNSWDGDNGLENRIKKAADGDVIHITKSISGVNDKSGDIVISKSVTFIGDGSNIVLTAKSRYRLFQVNSNGNVKFINLTFKDGYATYSGNQDGGAVRVLSGTITFDNCKFDNCKADDNGGAISIVSGSLYLNNCVFSGCSAKGTDNNGGGAVYVGSGASLKNLYKCSFSNCKASYSGTNQYGGAIFIYSLGNFDFDYCKFDICESDEYGGAIYIKTVTSGSTINFNYCNFTNCKAAYWGGAIDIDSGSLYLKNCIFSKCTVDSTKEDKGGAIYLGSGNSFKLDYCKFDNCEADEYGGAIYSSSVTSLILDHCNFTICKADIEGGAIYMGTSSINLKNCIFTTCQVQSKTKTDQGGAIYLGSGTSLDVEYCNFDNSWAGNNGGSFYLGNVNTIKFIYCNFTSSKTDHNGGAIFMNGGNSLNIKYCKFNDCKANGNDGGAIIIKSGTVDISNCNFTNCYAGDFGGAISMNGGTSLTLNNCIIKKGEVGNNGGAVSVSGGSSFTFNYCDFSECYAKCENLVNPYGGGAFIVMCGSTTRFNYCNFTKCSSGNVGGTIDIRSGSNEAKVYIDYCNFTASYSKDDGGVISLYNQKGYLEITNSNFKDCNATLDTTGSSNAEAGALFIYRDGGGNAGFCKNTTFINCNSEVGGAVTIQTCRFDIEDSYFENCKSSHTESTYKYGNAISYYASGDTQSIKNCQFIHNDDTSTDPVFGLIYLRGDITGGCDDMILNIKNCVLLNKNIGVRAEDNSKDAHVNFINCWVGDTVNNTETIPDWSNNLKSYGFTSGNVIVKDTLQLAVSVPKDVTYKGNTTLKYYFVGKDSHKNFTLTIRNMVPVLDTRTGSINASNISDMGKGFNVSYVPNLVGANIVTCYLKFDSNYFSRTLACKFYSGRATPNLIITVKDAVYGTHPMVYIDLISNTVEKINCTLTVLISSNTGYKKEYITFVSEGKAYISTDILDVSKDIYTVDIKWDGNDYYKNTSNKTNFVVSRANSTMILDIDNVDYGSNPIIAIYLWGINGEMLNATIDVTINKKVYKVKVSNGYGTAKVDILGANKYTAKASWAGNTNYAAINGNTTFNVSQYTPEFIVTINNVTYGTKASIVVYLMGANSVGITGNVVVKINNKSYTISVKNGYGYGESDLLGVSATGYKVEASFNGNSNYTKINDNTTFFVKQAVPELFIIVNDVYYGEKPVIEARLVGVNNEKLTTDITVKVDGKDYLVHIVNGEGSNTTDVLAVKNGYKASSTWNGNANYTNTSCNISFNVLRVTPHLEVVVNDVYYGNNATIQVKLTGVNGTNLTAKVNVIINGKNYSVDVNNGVGVAKTIILPAKDTDYEVEANLVATENYTAAHAKNNFTVFKTNPNLFLIINNVYYGTQAVIEVRLTGVNDELLNETVIAIVDGENYLVKVVNGVGTNKTKVLGAGKHFVSIYWEGNNNYNSASASSNFTVLQVVPTMKASAKDVTAANNATIVVEVWGLDFAPLNATVNVVVNGTEYVLDVVNGVGYLEINKLAPGKYDVKVELDATKNYTAANAITSFKVYQGEPILNVDVLDVVFGTNATVDIRLINEEGEGLDAIVEVIVNNKTYKVDVIKGVGSCKLDVLDVGHSYEVIAILNVSENYTGAIAKTTFKVNKAQPTLIIDIEDCLYGDFSIMNVYLTGVNNTGLDGFVYITIFNQTHLVPVEKGYGILSLKLDAGSYYAFVSFNGDENYETAFNYTSFDVIGSNATLIVKSKDVSYGEKSIVEVTLTGINGEKLDGVVWIFVNNETSYLSVINGYGFTELDLPAGIQYLSAYWLGNDDYNPLMNITSFVVYPANPDLVVTVENVSFDKNATVNIQLTGINGEKLTGIVEVKISDKTYYVNVTDGVGSIKIDLLPVGEYDVVASWKGNTNYTETSSNTILNISKAVSSIIIEIGDVYVDEIINITVKTNAVGSMVIIVDGEKYNVNIVNGVAFVSVPGLKFGTYEVIANYNGNENFTAGYNKTFLRVKKISDYSINISAKLNEGSEGGNVTVTLPIDATGEITVFINDVEYYGKIKEGKVIIFVSDLEPNVYNVVVNYDGDDKYEGLVNQTTVVVTKVSDYGINITGDLNIGSEGGEIVIDFPSDATGEVIVYIDGEKYTGEIVYGKVVINVPDLTPGDHDIIINYSGDDKYDGFTNETTINVPKVTEFDFDIYSYLEGDTGVILVFLPHDATGYVEVNGVNYKADVVNGTATVKIPGITPGSFVFNIIYSGDNKYESISDSRNITFEYSYLLYVQNLTKYFGNGNQLYAILIDSYGKGIANQTILISINGNTYSRVTDEQGIVKLNVNLQPGTYDVEVSCNDTLKSTGVINILTTIEGKDLVKIYKNGSQYSAKFLDIEGNPLVNTNVIFNINGVFYVRSTDENGIAILNINLLPGTYIITAQNSNGQLSSNNITVLPILEADDLTKKVTEKASWDITAYNELGEVAVGVVVTININGVFYNRTTDNNGVARLNINLNPGEYIATAYYNNFATSNKITVLE